MIACVSASRRGTEVIDFVIATAAGQPIGRFADGRVAELFLDAAKVDPLPPNWAQGVAIGASAALQSGYQIETLGRALAGHDEGPLSGPLIQER